MLSTNVSSVRPNVSKTVKVRIEVSETIAQRLSQASTEWDLQGEFGLCAVDAQEIVFLAERAAREGRSQLWLIGEIHAILRTTGVRAAN